jgi:antitoxin (DNA-binding transcriptional repressor) of toxin-antitoxin stability system
LITRRGKPLAKLSPAGKPLTLWPFARHGTAIIPVQCRRSM